LIVEELDYSVACCYSLLIKNKYSLFSLN